MSKKAGEPQVDVGAAFDAAHAGFVSWGPLLWDRIGAATVTAAGLRPGDQVLDACCGAGAATLPAARAVGPAGRVDGVDLSGKLLAAARESARAQQLPQAGFHQADVLGWSPPGGRPYDVVLCGFGVFFLPDLDAGGAHLLSLLRPGGRLAITTWASGSLDPLVTPFAQAAATEYAAAGRPPAAPTRARAASGRVDTPAKLAAWLQQVGASQVSVEQVALDIPLTGQRAWEFVTGAGPRALLFGLDDHAVAAVRRRYLDALAGEGVTALHAVALIGLGTRGP